MKALIVTGGAQPEKELLYEHLNGADLVIGVDRAADTLVKYSIRPNILIGDFDSAQSDSVEKIEAMGSRLMRLPTHKNETDTEAAVTLALDAGADDIVILGALGLRLDHALGNLSMLIKADRAGARCRIIDEVHEITAARGNYELHGRPGQTVSILPMAGDTTVTATNLVYPLDELLLRSDAARGISNTFSASPARLSILGGYALIIKIS
jgi:thiamine pyrophosphokinase